MGSSDLEIWLNHFEYHAEHPRPLPHGVSDVLWPHERRRIASSIATFQLGEQSEGRTLLRAAERFARARRIPSLARIVELLIRDERRHAALLGAFMTDHQIPLKTRDWTDRVFRCVRRLAGLELYLYVLMSAELIGIVYYRALERATDCRRLQLLCRAFVADELAHVGFESHLLVDLRAGRPRPLRALMRGAHRAFFASTALIVGLTHRTVLRQAGYGPRGFLRACLAEYAFYLEPASKVIEAIAISPTIETRGTPRTDAIATPALRGTMQPEGRLWYHHETTAWDRRGGGTGSSAGPHRGGGRTEALRHQQRRR